MGKGPGQKIKNSDHGPSMKRVLDPPIAVTARIEWINDGEECVDTVALAWHMYDVQVVIVDDRHVGTTAWIPASDVKRR